MVFLSSLSSGAVIGDGQSAVASNIANTTYRLQWWDFTKFDLPEISNGELMSNWSSDGQDGFLGRQNFNENIEVAQDCLSLSGMLMAVHSFYNLYSATSTQFRKQFRGTSRSLQKNLWRSS